MALFANTQSMIDEARALQSEIGAYLDVSARLRDAFADPELIGTVEQMETEQIDWPALGSSVRRRISQMLGPQVRQRIEMEPDDPRTAFSLATYTLTVLPRESVVAEAQTALDDFAQVLRSETHDAILHEMTEEFLRDARPGIEALMSEGNHQTFIDQLFAALAVQSVDVERPARDRINSVLRLRKEQAARITGQIMPHWHNLMARMPANLVEPAARNMAAADSPTNGKEKPEMTISQNDLLGDRIVDAISRLQEGSGGASGVAGGIGASDFNLAIDQQIYASIGVPSLSSDIGLATDRRELADKLFAGLDRTIVRKDTAYGATFTFNPAIAQMLVPVGGGVALGAQGVVADTVATLKPAVIRCIELLRPEVCHCSDEEVDDLKDDVGRGLDMIARESREATGIYRSWAATIIKRVISDVRTIVRIYGIRVDINRAAKNLVAVRIGNVELFDEDPQHGEHPSTDRDVGYLSLEINDQAVRTIFEHIATIAHLIRDLEFMPLGPLTVRLRAVVEAIPPAVADARSALNLAGVGDSDRTAEFLPEVDDPFGIELARLLDLTETTANEYRVRLLKADINKRDLGWFIQAFTTITTALQGVNVEAAGPSGVSLRTPTINRNRYALGARQLAEVHDHADTALGIARRLYRTIDDRGPAYGRMDAKGAAEDIQRPG